MSQQHTPPKAKGRLIYRQSAWTRVTHWLWAVCLFFLLLSGLQIFNARPDLYIGKESGFEYDNAFLSIGAELRNGEMVGITDLFGVEIVTTGVLGVSGSAAAPQTTAFPGWLTIPSTRDLATGRIVHFFFAWIFVPTILVWLVASLFNGHLGSDLIPLGRDWRRLPADFAAHVRLKFSHGPRYNTLQKISYAVVLLVLFPLMVLTGLTMSPGINAQAPFLLDLFGGRQTARTIHFFGMLLLVGFFVIHISMVFLAGPINGLRSMITGWYRTDPHPERDFED